MTTPTLTFPELFTSLLQYQESLNCQVHPKWREQNFNWNLAIHAEFYGEVLTRWEGWKWWKKSNPVADWDAPARFQLALEFIDILHFQASEYLQVITMEGVPTSQEIAENILEEIEVVKADIVTTLAQVWEAISETSPEKMTIQWTFCVLLKVFGYSPEQVCELYFAKNALNSFRQEMQKRPGGYNKVWICGKEDNYYLEVAFLDFESCLTDLGPNEFILAVKDTLWDLYEHN